ncbi:Mn superoxide dismutase [Melampsora larici-populina 98AG31]|uniref:Superoxide dismutase n=1 Tax=Melampsora larici-populina (strain 98AG31 / pathotype 3-4-7) TaxID=747676 RepID=F4RQ24_MELLP|nr:Mn superoxide dismutase [Melampsora larici-populina 98AG31]EGG05480.1 Mn superoxide dismutase [Melampsora larici-populina 98AG31]
MFKTGITKSVRIGSSLNLRTPNLGASRSTSFLTFNRGNHTLPNLPYAYNALEPAISEQIMELHHSKHHAAYVNGLNAAEEAYASALKSNDALKQIELQAQIKFNGGGHINHSLFWKNLQPEKSGGGQLKDGAFAKAVQEQYGGLEKLKANMNAAAMGIQGSGWAWLAVNIKEKKLTITSTGNQDPLTAPLVPIIGIDMWEHAFYLQHQNRKADYLTNIWKVINFEEAEARYKSATA